MTLNSKHLNSGESQFNDGEPHLKTHSQLEKLAASIDGLAARIDQFMLYAHDSMPNKVVYLIFILVFSLIFGIESLQFIFKTWLPKLLAS